MDASERILRTIERTWSECQGVRGASLKWEQQAALKACMKRAGRARAGRERAALPCAPGKGLEARAPDSRLQALDPHATCDACG